MSKKYTIKQAVFGDDYLEDDKGNKIELKRPLFDDPYYEIEGEKVYPEKEGSVLTKRGIVSNEEVYKKVEGVVSDHYEKKGICFISTACTEAMGLPDNCEELRILRRLREKHLLGTPAGNRILHEYRVLSDVILNWIENQDDKKDLYYDLYHRLVCETIRLIGHGKINEAIYHYETIVREYKELAAQKQHGKL